MKSVYRSLLAVALVVPMGALATSAGAATTPGTSCAAPSGTIKIAPGLTNVKKVQTITFNLPIKACKGGGVTSGLSKGSLKTAPTSISSFAEPGPPLKVTTVLTWNNKKTSAFTASTTTKVAGGAITSALKGKVTKGLFVGKTVTVTLTVKLGPLVNGAITNLTIKGKTAFVIK
jgi:hypothetical protein